MAKKQCIRPAPVSSEINTNHVPPSVMASAVDSAVQHEVPVSEAIDLVSPSVAAIVHLPDRVQDLSAASDGIVLASPVVVSPVVNHPDPNLQGLVLLQTRRSDTTYDTVF